jgi:hypothetical protein
MWTKRTNCFILKFRSILHKIRCYICKYYIKTKVEDMLSEIRQAQKDIHHMFSFICGSYIWSYKTRESGEEGRGTGETAQVLEYLPSKCEALNSDPGTTTQKKKKKKAESSGYRKWNAGEQEIGRGWLMVQECS